MKYFDYNATTPMSPGAHAAWLEAQETAWQNPSGLYRSGIRTKVRLEKARDRLAALFDVNPETLIFCSGATEACNLWVRSFFENPKHAGQKVLASAQEHSCMRGSLSTFGGDRVQWFSPHRREAIDTVAEALETQSDLGAVVMMAANNETGICYPWQEIADTCRRRGIPFFCDTSQWIGKMSLDGFDRLDYFCASAHKFGGPKGVGFLKVSKRFPTVRGSVGGGQEWGIRAGTENYPAIEAMVAALEACQEQIRQADFLNKRFLWLKDFADGLKKRVPGSVIHGEGYPTLWNTASISVPLKASRYWINALEEHGFEVSGGAACNAGKKGLSPVLKDMGFPDSFANSTLRISSGWETRKDDWKALLDALVKVYEAFSDEDGDLTEVISLDSF